VKVKAIIDAVYSFDGFTVERCPKGQERDLEPAQAEKLIGLKMFEVVKEAKPAAPKRESKPAKLKKEVKKVEEQGNNSAND
jgi:hypothetical protein